MALLFIGLPAALVWVRMAGLGFGIPEKVSEELSRGELVVKVGKMAFDIFRGFVAREVHIMEKSTSRQVAHLDQIVITPRLADLVRGKFSVEHMALAGAEGEFAIASNSQPQQMLEISRLEGTAWLMEDHLRIPFLKGKVQGILIEGDALIVMSPPEPRGSSTTSQSASSDPRSQEVLHRFLQELGKIQFPKAPPRLQLSLRGSTSRLAVEHFEFRSAEVAGPGWRLESVEAEGSWDGQSGQLERLEMRDAQGQLRIWGNFDRARARFEGICTLAPGQWLEVFAPKSAPDWKFSHPPEILFQGQWPFSAPEGHPVISGTLSARQLSYREASFQALSARFAWKPGVLLARGIDVQAGGGRARGDLWWEKGNLRIRLASRLRPDFLMPALDSKLRATLALFQFRDPPAFEIAIQGPSWADLHGEGNLHLGRTAMRGSWVDNIESRISLADGAVTYTDCAVKKDRGRATGTFTYDFRNQLVRLRNIESTLQPVEVLMWADPTIAESVRPYRFVEGPRVTADGVVYMKTPSRNALKIALEAPRGLDYDLLGKTLRFERVAANLKLDGTDLTIKIPKAALMGGQVTMNASLSLAPERPHWSAEVMGQGVDFPSLTRLYFGYESSRGVASGLYSFRSALGRELDMTGQGWVRVENGNVFDIPLFGPLSDIISKILPGIGYETARLATADFEIAQRKIRTRNLEIEGKGFSLYGEGDIGFPKGEMDMSIRINARGIPGYLFFPVSKLFEYVSDGTFSNPRWRPKIIPRIPLSTGSNSQ